MKLLIVIKLFNCYIYLFVIFICYKVIYLLYLFIIKKKFFLLKQFKVNFVVENLKYHQTSKID